MNNRVLPILLFVLSIGVFFGYVNPQWTGTIADTKDAISADNRAIDAAKSYLKREQELMQQRDAIDQGDLARLAVFLPNGVDNVGLILSLNALAARSGLALSNIDITQQSSQAAATTPSEFGRASLTGSVDLTLSVTGSYAAFQKFLASIEHSERLLDVRNVSISGSNTGLYTYQMMIRFYWLR